MVQHNWLITDDGTYRAFGNPDAEEPENVYRLYRFLTELEDILANIADDAERLQAITPLVRKLLISSYWLQMEYDSPSPKTGWAVKFLYKEYQYPLTVQMVSWAPGSRSTIHNHGAWGLVALIGGQERNRIWRRAPQPQAPDRIEPIDELMLAPGDIVTFTPNAIHSVEPVGEEPTISFNLYGVTDFNRRYQFDPDAQTAQKF